MMNSNSNRLLDSSPKAQSNSRNKLFAKNERDNSQNVSELSGENYRKNSNNSKGSNSNNSTGAYNILSGDRSPGMQFGNSLQKLTRANK